MSFLSFSALFISIFFIISSALSLPRVSWPFSVISFAAAVLSVSELSALVHPLAELHYWLVCFFYFSFYIISSFSLACVFLHFVVLFFAVAVFLWASFSRSSARMLRCTTGSLIFYFSFYIISSFYWQCVFLAVSCFFLRYCRIFCGLPFWARLPAR